MPDDPQQVVRPGPAHPSLAGQVRGGHRQHGPEPIAILPGGRAAQPEAIERGGQAEREIPVTGREQPVFRDPEVRLFNHQAIDTGGLVRLGASRLGEGDAPLRVAGMGVLGLIRRG